MVLIDTSVWVDSDHLPDAPVAEELRRLLDRDEVATTELVVAEILQGALSEADFERLSSRFESVQWLHAEPEAWALATRLSFRLRRMGLTTPLSDLLVAAVALRADVPVFATDRHFDRVPDLKHHEMRT